MADFALPILNSTYSDLVDLLKARDVSSMKLFDGTTDSNLPSGTKRWNSTNSYFEKFDGSAWSPLAAKYMINVDLVDGCTVNDGGSTTSDLWTASKITTQLGTKLDASAYTAADALNKIKTVDGAGSGLDADLLDGMNATTGNVGSTIVSRDASGNFSAGTITASLSGGASTLLGDESNWANYRSGAVANMLGWKNYGNSHVIFDASAGTAPNGVSVNNTNPAQGWNATYPTLMGWNGGGTFGVRVDSARVSDSTTLAAKASTLASGGANGTAMTFNWSGQAGQPVWLWGGTDGTNMYVYNPSNFKVAGFNANAPRLNYCHGAGSDTVNNLALGNGTLQSNTTGTLNTAVGYYSLSNNTTGFNNTAVGTDTLLGNTAGTHNTAVGAQVMTFSGATKGNTGVGSKALYHTDGSYNTAVGYLCMDNTMTGSSNTAIGYAALSSVSTGHSNTCVGNSAGAGILTGTYNTAVGYDSLGYFEYSKATCIGAFTRVTADNQNQIGSSDTTTFVYGTVQNRSDRRDKADIRDSELGLDFIMSLRPVDYKWDMREDYIDLSKKPVRPESPMEPDEKDDEAVKLYNTELSKYVKDMERYEEALQEFQANNKLANIVSDGTKKRVRYHHGFIAQEVEELNADFGGLQNHTLKGGDDVMSLGYDEFIAPLVKAIQEQQVIIDTLSSRLEALENKINKG